MIEPVDRLVEVFTLFRREIAALGSAIERAE